MTGLVARSLVATTLTLAACGTSTTSQRAPSVTTDPAETIVLPSPRSTGPMSLEEALRGRRSVRSFTAEGLTFADRSQLLWAAQGQTASWGGRTAPSAGGLYPLELYLATADGLWRYVADGHKVQVRTPEDVRAGLAEASGGQASVATAPAVFVVTAVLARTAAKYGDRAERYVLLEAGHAAQNLLLQAGALGLGAVPVGAFDDGEVAAVLGLPSGEEPLYLIPVGHSAG
ncbi:MAG: SagB/ThcOx family dehydrogenase [Actinomycetota bacterium]